MEITNFGKDFIERTLDNLDKTDHRVAHTFTNLINSSLGLIVLPFEFLQSDNKEHLLDENIIDVSKRNMFDLRLFEPIKKTKNNETIHYPKTLYNLVRKIRNGIVHKHISPVNYNNELKSIIIWNEYLNNSTSKIKDLEIEFSEIQLKKFCIYIANKYLDTDL